MLGVYKSRVRLSCSPSNGGLHYQDGRTRDFYMSKEIWKIIEDFPRYKISSRGRVISYAKSKKGRMMILCDLN